MPKKAIFHSILFRGVSEVSLKREASRNGADDASGQDHSDDDKDDFIRIEDISDSFDIDAVASKLWLYKAESEITNN